MRGCLTCTRRRRDRRGRCRLTDEMLRDWPSGDLFGLAQNAGMGWDPREMVGPQYLLLEHARRHARRRRHADRARLSHGALGSRAAGAAGGARRSSRPAPCPLPPIAPIRATAARKGTTGMFDSLPYRNDAAIVFRRLIRSLPTRRGVLGVATCDKGLPAMMMALAGSRDLPCVLVPGGVTLPPTEGEDAGKVQSIGARYAHGEITLEEAAELGCRACASPGGGCQFLGTAATSQVVGEALGLSLPHSALAPSGQPIWLDMARRSAQALAGARSSRDQIAATFSPTPPSATRWSCTRPSAARPTCCCTCRPSPTRPACAADGRRLAGGERRVPRLVDVLPNGPVGHPTVRVFLAGGVPEVMLHLRELGLAGLERADGERTARWAKCWRGGRTRRGASGCARRSSERDGVDPDDVIMPPAVAKSRGLTSTVCFPRGNLAPEGSVIKSTAIDPRVVDADGVYRKTGPARVFTRERDAIAAIKGRGERPIKPGDVLVLIARGPMGSGMEETYQITSALQLSGLGTRGGRGHRRALLRREHRRVHRPRRARGAGRRPDRQGARRRPDSHRHRSQQAGGIDRPGRRRDARRSRQTKRRACWPSGRCAPTCIPTPSCPTTRGCGPRCSAPAAAPGAAASTTSSGSCGFWKRASERWRSSFAIVLR